MEEWKNGRMEEMERLERWRWKHGMKWNEMEEWNNCKTAKLQNCKLPILPFSFPPW